MKPTVLIACLAGGLSACAVPPSEELIYGRADCRRSSEPQVVSQFDIDGQFCGGRARATAAAANWRSQREVGEGLMQSCMAQRGYVLAPRRVHEARCGRAVPGGGLSRLGG